MAPALANRAAGSREMALDRMAAMSSSKSGLMSFGARGGTFIISPGSVLTKQPPRWVMAGELVETDRLRARRVAAVQPEWAERLGAHLVKRSYGEPRWDERGGGAVVRRRR